MSSDDDKTVFTPGQRQPSQADMDSTVFIPKPGAQRAAPAPSSPAAAAPASSAPAMLATELLQVERGLNPVISAATTLLAVANKLRNTAQHADVAGLHRNLVEEIKLFDSKLKSQNTRPEIALASRYQICAALDEAVMNTPWGAQAGWAQRSLLSLFHKETSGGEKFFAILAKMMEAPSTNLDIIELDYLLLSLGFEGKFRIDPRGRDQLETLRDNLYNTIEKLRGEFQPDLSINANTTVRAKHGLMEFLPLWVVSAVVLALILVVYSGFSIWMSQATESTAAQLNTLSAEILKTDKKQ
ncbi:type IVB secretion system protein IcmH/DotU [Ketobacter alkanivorans]|uniref:Type IV / VI secretion system DotU domain-containing protein n=1 Tax=Ketobacter alkanivorans TaxID=1917421 RepID=A0A2K9LL92_9GAMM|nr:type IVB secretion system protein IcmH/DotU [Ketobacter alkanivorans]AUM13129.1 hypothetical protein Kalk_12145 [Ketobacter alkanivorans]